MTKKKLIIALVLIVLCAGGFFAYKYYEKYKEKNKPNYDIVNEPVPEDVLVTQPPIYKNVDELAKPKDPQYTDLSAESKSLYPTLSGVYEQIWDEYESHPIDILAKGKEQFSASYKIIWAKRYLYIQVTVSDTTPYTAGEDYRVQDSVEIFINEDGKKNSSLLVGDAHYIINRDNVRSAGFGASSNFESVTYGIDPVTDAEGNIIYNGYIAEAVIPLMTIKATKNSSIGFDIQVNDANPKSFITRTEKEITEIEKGADKSKPGVEKTKRVTEETIENVVVMKWASDYLYTFQNFSALGTLTFK